MLLFISYARVDKPYMVQIVQTLVAHEPWYDQRLFAGQHWWQEILRRLNWCEGFIYMLSPESIDSKYCQQEYQLARSMGRHIFPVLIKKIDPDTMPEELSELQYVDFSEGITPEAVANLLNAIILAERQQHASPAGGPIGGDLVRSPVSNINPAIIISSAAAAMEKGQYDHVVFLLKQALANGLKSTYINIPAMLAEAEQNLERQSKRRVAEREYPGIAALFDHKSTYKLGEEAFAAFRSEHPDYDPLNLAGRLYTNGSKPHVLVTPPPAQPAPLAAPSAPVEPAAPVSAPVLVKPRLHLALLDFCDIPAGIVAADELNDEEKLERKPFYVDTFRLAKYPVTNAQYQVFLDDPGGYANVGWWQFSHHAHNWRVSTPEAVAGRFKGDERPREMVNWYDAMAFCFWLSAQLGLNITLPNEYQWQRAARGDDSRLYPWGGTFDKDRCNTRESDLKMTSNVTRYAGGVAPFGNFDMAGNVWEWCLNTKSDSGARPEITSSEERAVFGGSFVSGHQRSQIPFRYYLNPQSFYASIGFRVAQLLG